MLRVGVLHDQALSSELVEIRCDGDIVASNAQGGLEVIRYDEEDIEFPARAIVDCTYQSNEKNLPSVHFLFIYRNTETLSSQICTTQSPVCSRIRC